MLTKLVYLRIDWILFGVIYFVSFRYNSIFFWNKNMARYKWRWKYGLRGSHFQGYEGTAWSSSRQKQQADWFWSITVLLTCSTVLQIHYHSHSHVYSIHEWCDDPLFRTKISKRFFYVTRPGPLQFERLALCQDRSHSQWLIYTYK